MIITRNKIHVKIKTNKLNIQDARAPNITGRFAVTTTNWPNYWNYPWGNSYGNSVSGAMYAGSFLDYVTEGGRGYYNIGAGNIEFNASRCSNTYKNRNELNPINFTYNVWKRIS